MKKILIAGLCACALMATSCGTTGNVAENNPQTHSAPDAERRITQMDTDGGSVETTRDDNEQEHNLTAQPNETEAQADTQTVGREGTTIGNAGGDAGIQILGTQTATAPTDETETTSAQSEQTNADEETDGMSPLVTRERDEDFEIIAEADVLQNAPNADESGVASTRLTEPEIFDEPDPNATNTLAETAPDAEGTTPLQQTTLPSAAGTVATTGAPAQQTTQTSAQPATSAAADTTRPAAESTAPRASPAVQQGRATPAQSTQNASTANTGTNAPLSTRAQTATNATTTNAGGQTTTRSPAAQTATAQTANQVAQTTTTPAAPTAQSASAPTSDTTQTEQTLLTDEYGAAEESGALIPLEKQTVVPSRSVTIKNNQYLDVVYPGSGWVYLGEAEENRDQKKQPIFSYFGRKLGTTDTTFTLRSRKPGTTLLHFYKNDALTGQYIDDYLAVTVESENAKAGVRATAPAYAEVVPPKPSRQTRQSYENVVSTGNEIAGSSPTMTHAHAATTNANAATTRSAQSGANMPSAQTEQGTDTTTASTAQSTAVVPVAEDRGVKTVIQTTESAPSGEAKSLATAPAYNGTTNTATNGTAQTTTQGAAGESDLDLLEQAKRSYAAKQYETALDQVQRYLDDATSKIDEALFLQGQILEAESSVKSIRSAIDSYESLTKNYPMSALWGKANNRIIYLKRFYIEIR